jgi:hypothetical protein
MNFTGSFFVDEDLAVLDEAGKYHPVTLVLDGLGGLFVHLTLPQATMLHSLLGDALMSIEHDTAAM